MNYVVGDTVVCVDSMPKHRPTGLVRGAEYKVAAINRTCVAVHGQYDEYGATFCEVCGPSSNSLSHYDPWRLIKLDGRKKKPKSATNKSWRRDMNMLDGNTAALRAYQNEQDQDDLSHELFGDRVLQDLKYELLSGGFIDTTSWGKKVDLHFILDGEDFTDWIVKLAVAQDYADVAVEIRDRVEKKVEEFLKSDPVAQIIAERVRELVMERE